MAPTKAQLLVIEGKRADRPSFVAGLLKKGFLVTSASSGSKALALVAETRPDLVVVDAASMRTSGKRICRSLRQNLPGVPILLIQDENSPTQELDDVDIVLTLPFTLQKLLNRIKPFLPVEKKNVLIVGPFQLDVDQRWARCEDRQVMLTPRLATLLKILMERAGEVIPREALFCEVWETEYTGDTRTLDVHISWLRQAVEVDPHHPRYIKTVRGLGYRLDVDGYRPTSKNGRPN